MFSGANKLSDYRPRNVIIWMGLAFQAGAVNAGGFLACHRFVTHTTGFATLFGAEFSQGHLITALSMATVPLFFLSGAMLSAYFVDRQIALERRPRYEYLLGAISFLFLVVAILGYSGVFGKFGETYEDSSDYMLLATLAMAMGIQNAFVTSASGSVVRTTHLTGITTDLGIGLVRIFTTGAPDSIKTIERRASKMRLGIIFSFICGSTLAASVFLHNDYSGFLIPALSALGILFYARKTAQRPTRTLS